MRKFNEVCTNQEQILAMAFNVIVASIEHLIKIEALSDQCEFCWETDVGVQWDEYLVTESSVSGDVKIKGDWYSFQFDIDFNTLISLNLIEDDWLDEDEDTETSCLVLPERKQGTLRLDEAFTTMDELKELTVKVLAACLEGSGITTEESARLSQSDIKMDWDDNLLDRCVTGCITIKTEEYLFAFDIVIDTLTGLKRIEDKVETEVSQQNSEPNSLTPKGFYKMYQKKLANKKSKNNRC